MIWHLIMVKFLFLQHSDMNDEMKTEAMELCVTACEKFSSNNEVSAFLFNFYQWGGKQQNILHVTTVKWFNGYVYIVTLSDYISVKFVYVQFSIAKILGCIMTIKLFRFKYFKWQLNIYNLTLKFVQVSVNNFYRTKKLNYDFNLVGLYELRSLRLVECWDKYLLKLFVFLLLININFIILAYSEKMLVIL